MSKNFTIGIIIIGLILIAGSYFLGFNLGKIAEFETPGPGNVQEEQIDLDRLNSILFSDSVQRDFYVSGVVTKIEDRRITVSPFEKEEKLVIPIKQDAEILKGNIVKEVSGKSEGVFIDQDGNQAEIDQDTVPFEEIKVGDNVIVRVDINQDYNIEGILVRIIPQ